MTAVTHQFGSEKAFFHITKAIQSIHTQEGSKNS